MKTTPEPKVAEETPEEKVRREFVAEIADAPIRSIPSEWTMVKDFGEGADGKRKVIHMREFERLLHNPAFDMGGVEVIEVEPGLFRK